MRGRPFCMGSGSRFEKESKIEHKLFRALDTLGGVWFNGTNKKVKSMGGITDA